MRRKACLGLSVLVTTGLFVVGCGDDDSGNTLPLNQLETSYMRAYCELAMDCSSEPFLAMLDGDVDACVDLISQEGDMSNGIGALIASVNAGDTEYDGAAARECLDAMETASCEAINAGAPDPSCDEVFIGVLPNAESCTMDEQCAGGWCDMTLACPGVCGNVVALSGDCTGDAPCANGLICEGGLCIADPGPLTVGQECASTERSCEWGTWCDYEMSGQCVAKVGVGQDCDWDEMCNEGLYCTDNMQCAEVQVVSTTGAACGGYEMGPYCSLAAGLGCVMDTSTGEMMGTTCQPLRNLNDDCLEMDSGTEVVTYYPCDTLAGLYCDMDTTNMTGVCLAKKDGGAPCVDSEECISGYCDLTDHCEVVSTDPCD